jgi:hypothetical protein
MPPQKILDFASSKELQEERRKGRREKPVSGASPVSVHAGSGELLCTFVGPHLPNH